MPTKLLNAMWLSNNAWPSDQSSPTAFGLRESAGKRRRVSRRPRAFGTNLRAHPRHGLHAFRVLHLIRMHDLWFREATDRIAVGWVD